MNNYLHIALWVICFFDAIILLCLPTTEKVFFSTEGGAARYVVDFVAMAIGLFVLHKNGFEKVTNKYIALFLLLMIASHFHAPNIKFESIFLPNDHAIFDYKPAFEVLILFIMFLGIMSLKITAEMKYLIRKSLVWIPTIYGIFSVLQRFGLDQFYQLAGPTIHMSRNPEVGGFISQPVFCAALIAICIPFVFRYGNSWQAIFCISGILATGNRSALIVVVICAFYASKYKLVGKALLAGYVSYLALGVILQFIPNLVLPHFGEERFTIWGQVLKDFTNPAFPGINSSHILTGTGIGSFSVIFPFYHNNGYYQAHNEFLEALRCLGVVGLFFMVKAILNIPVQDKVLANAFLASCILALTNSIWHVPQLAFITVFIVALLHNKTLGEQYVATT